MTTREEWLKKRNKGIGGSDVAAILGYSPYMTNVDLWEIKTGRKKQKDISENPRVDYGNKAEIHIIELFKLDYPEYELLHKPFDLRTHPKHNFIFSSLDGELTEKSTGRKGVYESKTVHLDSSVQRQKWDNQVPQHYYIQVIQGLLATGYEFAILNARFISKRDGKKKIWEDVYHFERSERLLDIELVENEEIKFWEYVKNDQMPPLKLPSI